MIHQYCKGEGGREGGREREGEREDKLLMLEDDLRVIL